MCCNSLVERPHALWAEPAPALTPVLPPLVMGWWTEHDRESYLPELDGKAFHRGPPAVIGIKGQHDSFDLWSRPCQPSWAGSSTDQGEDARGRKSCCQQSQAIKAAFDQDHPFSEPLWCLKAEPARRVGFDPTPGSARLVEYGLVRILIQSWFPLEECAPDESLSARGTKRKDDASDPALQERSLLC